MQNNFSRNQPNAYANLFSAPQTDSTGRSQGMSVLADYLMKTGAAANAASTATQQGVQGVNYGQDVPGGLAVNRSPYFDTAQSAPSFYSPPSAPAQKSSY